ncbi:MAG: hypothetical protein AAFP76_06095 [Bacteroidota bacterium]
MSLKNLVIVTTALLAFQVTTAQRNFDQNNHLGLIGGIGFFDINTDNFNTEKGTGYYLGFTTRGAFYNNFDLIYGVSFLQNQVGIFGRDASGAGNFPEQYVDFTTLAAQINLLGSFNIIHNHLSIEAGPILNVNGKLKVDREEFEDFVLDGYETLTAKDIENVSRVHFHAAAGITAGIENFRVGAMYQYGVTNLLNRLNDKEGIEKPANGKFEGNASVLIVTAVLYF